MRSSRDSEYTSSREGKGAGAGEEQVLLNVTASNNNKVMCNMLNLKYSFIKADNEINYFGHLWLNCYAVVNFISSQDSVCVCVCLTESVVLGE